MSRDGGPGSGHGSSVTPEAVGHDVLQVWARLLSLAEQQEAALVRDDLAGLEAILGQQEALIAQLPPPRLPTDTAAPPPLPDQQLALASQIMAIERRCEQHLRRQRDYVRTELLERAAHTRVEGRYGGPCRRRTPRFIDKQR